MTKRENERQEAIDHLRGIIKPGNTVHTVLRHVSRSGMTRGIDVYFIKDSEPVWITSYVGKAIDAPQPLDYWKKSLGLKVGGCGMHVVNSLSYALYGKGYKCLGKKGHCPSNYHVNHRDRVSCEGVPRWRVYRRDAEGMLQKAETFGTRAEAELAQSLDNTIHPEIDADYNRCRESDVLFNKVDLGDGLTVDGQPMHTIEREDGTEEVCPVCKGAGWVDNPEGPEKWNLVHTDGYALRHQWL